LTNDFIRLDTIAPDLVHRLKSASTHELREINRRVVGAALAKTNLQEPRIEAALAALQASRFGQSTDQTALSQLESELDNLGWDEQERMWQHAASKDDYDRAFARARAVSALRFALERDPLTAALQGVYEAIAATDLGEIRSIIDKLLADPADSDRS
jgi:hypothetical protein